MTATIIAARNLTPARRILVPAVAAAVGALGVSSWKGALGVSSWKAASPEAQ